MGTHYYGRKEEQRALDLFIAITRASSSVQRAALRQAPLPDDLTLSQFGVLEALLHLGPLPQHSLSEKLLHSKGNTSVVVSHLEKRGLIERVCDPNDRRQRLVSLTAEGKALIRAYFPRIADGFAHATMGLDQDEQETLTRLCKKLGHAANKHNRHREAI